MSTTLTQNNNAEFSCSVNGYIDMVSKATKISLTLITLFNSLVGTIINTVSPNFASSLLWVYNWLVSLTSWVGYLLAGVYFVSVDIIIGGVSIGDYVCTGSQYVYIIVYYVEYLVSLGTG